MRNFFRNIGRGISNAAKQIGNFVKKNPVVTLAAGALLIPGLGVQKALSGVFGKAGGAAGILKNPAVQKALTGAATTALTGALGGKPKSSQEHQQAMVADTPFLNYYRGPGTEQMSAMADLFGEQLNKSWNLDLPSYVPTTVSTQQDPLAPVQPPSMPGLEQPSMPKIGEPAAPIAPGMGLDEQHRAYAIRRRR